MTLDQKKQFISTVRAATHGMPKDEKLKTQELLLAGACMALKPLDMCPNEWTAVLFLGRAHKLFSARV